MSKEFKHLSFTNIKAKSDGRIRVGVCAVFGNVDSWGDRIHPGAFSKTITENFKQIKHLWMHDCWNPPIASIKELRELSKDELPAEVLEKAPEATGGLLVAREYYNDVPLADWVLKAIDAGDINEMSFAFEVVKSTETVEDTGMEDLPKRRIRELLELKLSDTSDVPWGMNGATVAAGAKNAGVLPLGALASQLCVIAEEIKAGRRNADADQKLIELIHSTAVELGAPCAAQPDETEDEKSRSRHDSDTSLSLLGLQIQQLQIEQIFNN